MENAQFHAKLLLLREESKNGLIFYWFQEPFILWINSVNIVRLLTIRLPVKTFALTCINYIFNSSYHYIANFINYTYI